MTSVLDQKRRVVLPRDVMEELGLGEGSEVEFEGRKGEVVLRKVEKKEDPLLRVMSWNPRRRGKVRPVKESEIKEVWR